MGPLKCGGPCSAEHVPTLLNAALHTRLNIVITFRITHSQAKCIVVTAVCVRVCLSLATFLHYCTDPDVTLANGSAS